MSALEHLVAAYVLNAVWQLPLLYILCSGLMRAWRNISPRLQHQLWLLCAVAAPVLPAAAVLGLFSAGRQQTGQSLPLAAPAYVWRAFFVAFSLMCVTQAWRLIQAGLRARALGRRAAPLVTGAALEPCILQRMIARGVRICFSPVGSERFGPLLVGLRRATILIPRGLADPANGRQLDTAIAHELAHIERKDMLLLVISEVALVPLAFHPVAAFLRRRLAGSREMACDEHVIQGGVDRFEYAHSLLELARNTNQSAMPLHALGLGDDGGLECRIRALLAATSVAGETLGRRGRSVIVLALAACCILLAEGGRSAYLWVTALPAPPALFRLNAPPPPPPPPSPGR